ncbi:MAG: hypothetical protein J6B89_03620 [Bacilli bacterium]|nr:hypothetical protein [Bacilli bacterium]
MEDKLMMNIIHDNYLKTREMNKRKRIKKEEKLTLLDKLFVGFGVTIFFSGLLLLISVINNLNF